MMPTEIEKRQSLSDQYNKKRDLAKAIHTLPGYLTQVFRDDKPLYFITIAKIQRALAIRFEITAKMAN